MGSTTGHTTGTLRWQAPELFQRGDDGHASRPSRESDSYSFGCVCLELITDRPPFSEIRTDFAVLAAIMNRETPKRPSVNLAHRGLDDSLWALIETCWNRNPSLRPTSKDIVEYFNVRVVGPCQLLVSDTKVQQMSRTSHPSEGTTSVTTSQSLAATFTAANTPAYANELSASFQTPTPNRQSADMLVRSLAATAAEAQTVAAATNTSSTIVVPPISKRGIQDRRSDFTPPRKRVATESKHANAVVTIQSAQSHNVATIEHVSSLQDRAFDEEQSNLPCPSNLQACDDKDDHYIILLYDMIFQRYQILGVLRQGPFDNVVEAFDTVKLTRVAIKIIRAAPKYRDMGMIEIRVLQKLKEHEQHNNKFIHLLDWFEHRNHMCLVSELLGMSVYDFLKKNDFQPFPRKHIQDFARQSLQSIAFLHDLRIIHTDLKPESMLLVRNSSQTVNYVVSNKRSAHTHQKRILDNTEIRLTDFGSATFEAEYHSTTVSTRHYRAPEVILGLGWSYPCDLFSLGCILVEFYTGVALFQTQDNLEHLAVMEMVMGHTPERITQSAVRNKPEIFHEGGRLDWPKSETSRKSQRNMTETRSLQELIPPEDAVNQHFLDLLLRLMAFDPAQRISVQDALQHPYFTLDIPMEDF